MSATKVLIEYEPGDEVVGPGWWIGTDETPGAIATGDGPDSLEFAKDLASKRWPGLPIEVVGEPER